MQNTPKAVTPWWKSWTGGAVILGIISALPGYIPQIAPFVPHGWDGALKLIAVLCGIIGSATAHGGATLNAAKIVQNPAEAEKVVKP